jgi:hypothetical protein
MVGRQGPVPSLGREKEGGVATLVLGLLLVDVSTGQVRDEGHLDSGGDEARAKQLLDLPANLGRAFQLLLGMADLLEPLADFLLQLVQFLKGALGAFGGALLAELFGTLLLLQDAIHGGAVRMLGLIDRALRRGDLPGAAPPVLERIVQAFDLVDEPDHGLVEGGLGGVVAAGERDALVPVVPQVEDPPVLDGLNVDRVTLCRFG